ncbi:extensin family protein [Roseomonas aeriglobus]|nr:extensin family protein [Roseomonas aeriglobus]
MKGVRQFLIAMTVAAVILAGVFAIYALVKSRPQDLPWTPLDLAEKPGMFTGRKLAALGDDFAQCRALMDKAGVRYTVLDPVQPAQAACGYDNGVRPTGGAAALSYAPAGLGMACPVAAAMAMLEWNVIQPAAETHFGSPVRTIEHFGSYNCRRLYGRSSGDYSQHATANAIDIAGFVLRDGTRVTVVGDWDGSGPKGAQKAAFLREVRDGACKLFATTLSPDYNAAHRDHFHLDQADRGAMGWRACR